MRLPIVLHPDPDGGFTVTCPAIPGCVTEGDSREEALANMAEAMALHLEALGEEPHSPGEEVLFGEVSLGFAA